MATEPNSAPASAWHATYQDYRDLTEQLAQADLEGRLAKETQAAELEDCLLLLPAPSFADVVEKLGWLWETELHGLDRSSEEKTLIIHDLQRLIQNQAALLGPAPSI